MRLLALLWRGREVKRFSVSHGVWNEVASLARSGVLR